MSAVVIAPDKFKGSLSAADAARAIALGLGRHVPDEMISRLPVADGGEGTIDACSAGGFAVVPTRASGPWGGPPRPSRFAMRGRTAVIELAATVGPATGGDPLTASTRGVGEVIRHALDLGCDEVVLAVGGSVSTDGGVGMLQSLGLVLRDGESRELTGGIADMDRVETIDVSGMDRRLPRCRVTLAADVTNPLLGPNGAAAVFGPQKGATPAQVALLEERLHRWSRLVTQRSEVDCSSLPGAGAAGGTGFAALALLGARPRPGIDVVCSIIGLDAAIAGASLIITGEGRLDTQSLNGKAPVGIARKARVHAIPAVAVAGSVLLDRRQSEAAGFTATYALTDSEPDPMRAMRRCAELLTDVGARIGTAVVSHRFPGTGRTQAWDMSDEPFINSRAEELR